MGTGVERVAKASAVDPAAEAAMPGTSAASSARVPDAPHAEHHPVHCGAAAPHSVQR
jgi:hypothetical protein